MVEDQIVTVIIGTLYGMVYGAFGIVTKKPEDERIDPRKLARTVTVFAAAGALVAAQGRELTFNQVDQTTAEVGLIGILFDHLWSRVSRQIRNGG